MKKKWIHVKNHLRESQLFSHRTMTIAVIILVLMSILLLRLAYIQLFQHTLYSTLSQKNIVMVTPIEPNRGLIFDRNGVLLAKNIPVFNLSLIPDFVKDIDDTIVRLQKIIPITDEDIKNFHQNLLR